MLYIKKQQILYRKRMLWVERDHLIQKTFPSSYSIIIVLPNRVVLIMRIINIIINMDDVKQERSNKSPTLKLNKRLKKVFQQQIQHTRQGIYGILGLEKTNNAAFVEVKLIVENPRKEQKMECFPKVQDLLIQKRGIISINFCYTVRLHC